MSSTFYAKIKIGILWLIHDKSKFIFHLGTMPLNMLDQLSSSFFHSTCPYDENMLVIKEDWFLQPVWQFDMKLICVTGM